MDRREAIRALLAVPITVGATGLEDLAAQDGWTPLFNGRDLDGWETFLGRPHRSVDIPGAKRQPSGEYAQPLGVDVDPRKVFSVVTLDGAPAIRISGEIYGALTTRDELENYHLRFEVKWGEKRWPPRQDQVRDTGCCYHASGPHGASYGFWMRSCEFQIQEGDFGDFYSLAGAIVDVEATRVQPDNPKSDLAYAPGAPLITGTTRRAIKRANRERPRGEWNTLELYCVGDRSVHVVNGEAVMRLSGIRQPVPGGATAALTRGRVQLQSEGGEVYFRDIAVRRVSALPPASSL